MRSQGSSCHMKYRLLVWEHKAGLYRGSFKGRGCGAGSVSSGHQDSCDGASKNSSRQSLAVSSGEKTVKPIVRGSLKIS